MRHMPLVAFVVSRMSTDNQKTLGLDREDALAYGIEGLIQAVDAFDEDARHQLRQLRRPAHPRLDPRRHPQDGPAAPLAPQERARGRGRLAGALRRPRPLADAEGDRLPPGHRRSSSSTASSATPARSSSRSSTRSRTAAATARPRFDPVDEDESGDPAKAADHNASLALLDVAMHRLNARDRAILQLRYTEAKPFHEIGQMMGLSESRVCQLHKRILGLLRRQINAQLEDVAAA